MTRHFDILIVGSGHGGAQAAAALRQNKFEGTIAIVGEEADIPYERPPLSKDYLMGQKDFERLLIRPSTFWSDRGIDMITGTRVVQVDAEAHTVETHSGDKIGYRQLIWAAGGHPRRLTCSGHDLAGVHCVRTRADVDTLRGELNNTLRVCVVGGGYIGLEAAAALATIGKKVTVIESEGRVLPRVAGETLSRFFEAQHRSRGVDVRLGIGVDCVEETRGRASGVKLTNGETIPCEMVIVGIGIVPSIEPLLHAGAKSGNGVNVDGSGRTSLPDVFAIGDCALHTNKYAGGLTIRLESVQNANDTANVVAKTITGTAASYNEVPWFWSNQYDLRLQTIGLSQGYDREVLRGDPANHSFSIVYLKESRVIALDCVNATRDYVQGRGLVVAGSAPPLPALADAGISLKDLISKPPTEQLRA